MTKLKICNLPCLRCNKPPPSDKAHVRTGTGGGIAIKPDDKYILPLCRECHSYQHQIGESRFYKDAELAKQVAERLSEGDVMYMLRARCDLF